MTTIWPNGPRRAGFELAVAYDLFVHHFGSRTFAGNGVDAEKLLDENAAPLRGQVGFERDQWSAGGFEPIPGFVDGQIGRFSRRPESGKHQMMRRGQRLPLAFSVWARQILCRIRPPDRRSSLPLLLETRKITCRSASSPCAGCLMRSS